MSGLGEKWVDVKPDMVASRVQLVTQLTDPGRIIEARDLDGSLLGFRQKLLKHVSKLDQESIVDKGRSILFRLPLAITRLATAITSSSSEKRCRFLVSLTDVQSMSAPSLERFSRSSNLHGKRQAQMQLIWQGLKEIHMQAKMDEELVSFLHCCATIHFGLRSPSSTSGSYWVDLVSLFKVWSVVSQVGS